MSKVVAIQYPKTIPRKQRKDWVLNPLTGRHVRRGGKKYRSLVSDGVLKTKHNSGEATVIAQGTKAELEITRAKLLESKVIDLENQTLEIRGNRLIKVRRRLTRFETEEHIQKHTIDSMIQNRALMRSRLNDEQITDLLLKICDAKIMGVQLNLDDEILDLLSTSDQIEDESPPPSPPKLVRQVGEHKKRKPKLPRRRNRFAVKQPPPPMTTDAETTEAPHSDTEISD